MNKRFGTVLLVALLMSGGVSALLYRMLGGKVMTAAPAPQQTSKVLVAAHVLQVGQLTKAEDLRVVQWKGTVPPGVLHAVTPALNRGVIATIYEGEPIVESRLAQKGAGGGLAATIPPGMRAVAVRMNDVTGVSGFVLPGMRVDVIVAGNPPGNSMPTTSKTLLQNIEVLSAGQKFQKDAEGKPVTVPVVNLLVTPQQAEVLSLAASQEQVQLVLRNPADQTVANTEGANVASLFTAEVPKKAIPPAAVFKAQPREQRRPAPPKPLIVEVIQGTKRSEVSFQPDLSAE